MRAPAVGRTLAFLSVASVSMASGVDGVVARVGDTPIGASVVSAKIATMHSLERTRYGENAERAVHGYIEHVLVRDALLANESKGVESDPLTRFRIERALSRGVLRDVERQLGPPSNISVDDVRAYYVSHADQFSSPEKLALFRILLPNKQVAVDAIARLKKKLTLEAFTKLARDESLDKATHLRAGSLGFVAPDGASSFVHVQVDRAVVEAARGVKDGELVATPISEGDHFAVIWRRGTVVATQVSLDAATEEIRQTLWRQRFELASKTFIDAQRSSNVKRVNDTLVTEIDPPKVEPPMVVRGTQPIPEE